MKPRLKLNTRDLLSFRLQVEQIFCLLDGVGKFSGLFVPCLIGEDVEVILKNVNSLVGLKSCFHFWIDIVQEVGKVIILDFHGIGFGFGLSHLEALVDLAFEKGLRASFCIRMRSLQSI